MTTRRVWLVDIGYVAKASQVKFKLDYVGTWNYLQEIRGPTTVYLFNGYDPAYPIRPGLQAFYSAMQRQGMMVRLHPMGSSPTGESRQRRVDVDFGAHLVWQASLPDVEAVIITTGDQDFVPAVELARDELGKQVILFAYDVFVHQDLEAAVDDRWCFEDERDRLEWRW